ASGAGRTFRALSRYLQGTGNSSRCTSDWQTPRTSLQRCIQEIGQPGAGQGNALLGKGLRRRFVTLSQCKRSDADADRLNIDAGFRRLEALVDPYVFIGNRCKLGIGLGKLLGCIDRILRMSARAEHIVPEAVQLDRTASAAAMNLDVISAGVAAR